MKPTIIVFTNHSDQRLTDLLKKQGRSLPPSRGSRYEVVQPEHVAKLPLAALKQAMGADQASALDVDRILNMIGEA